MARFNLFRMKQRSIGGGLIVTGSGGAVVTENADGVYDVNAGASGGGGGNYVLVQRKELTAALSTALTFGASAANALPFTGAADVPIDWNADQRYELWFQWRMNRGVDTRALMMFISTNLGTSYTDGGGGAPYGSGRVLWTSTPTPAAPATINTKGLVICEHQASGINQDEECCGVARWNAKQNLTTNPQRRLTQSFWSQFSGNDYPYQWQAHGLWNDTATNPNCFKLEVRDNYGGTTGTVAPGNGYPEGIRAGSVFALYKVTS